MNNTLQLEPEHLALIRRIVATVIPRGSVAVFGSCATGRARPYSDIDLLVSDPPLLTWQQRTQLLDAFEASPLPFRVDLVEVARVAPEFSERILQEAVSL